MGMDMPPVVYFHSDMSGLHNQLDATDPNPSLSGMNPTAHRGPPCVEGDAWAGTLPTPLPQPQVGAVAVVPWVHAPPAKQSGRENLPPSAQSLPSHRGRGLIKNSSNIPFLSLTTDSKIRTPSPVFAMPLNQ